MKTSHTAGPWNLDESKDPKDNTIAVFNSTQNKHKRRLICTVNPAPFYADNQDANARLIASAPELLSALEACLRDCDSTEPVHPRGRVTLSMTTQQQARAAIRKAKGQE